MSNVVEQNSEVVLSYEEAFRLRMESQCHQIREYRLAILREDGRLLSPDEAALEWIERYAARFDYSPPTSDVRHKKRATQRS